MKIPLKTLSSLAGVLFPGLAAYYLLNITEPIHSDLFTILLF